MFTIAQIQQVHSQVKSGADFPQYVQDMKKLGVRKYDHFVSDGHIHYYGSDHFTLSARAKWASQVVAEQGNKKQLKESLIIHQQGGTDYFTFCQQAAEAGVEKWTVDMERMVCVYYDKPGNELLVETIPDPISVAADSIYHKISY